MAPCLAVHCALFYSAGVLPRIIRERLEKWIQRAILSQALLDRVMAAVAKPDESQAGAESTSAAPAPSEAERNEEKRLSDHVLDGQEAKTSNGGTQSPDTDPLVAIELDKVTEGQATTSSSRHEQAQERQEEELWPALPLRGPLAAEGLDSHSPEEPLPQAKDGQREKASQQGGEVLGAAQKKKNKAKKKVRLSKEDWAHQKLVNRWHLRNTEVTRQCNRDFVGRLQQCLFFSLLFALINIMLLCIVLLLSLLFSSLLSFFLLSLFLSFLVSFFSFSISISKILCRQRIILAIQISLPRMP